MTGPAHTRLDLVRDLLTGDVIGVQEVYIAYMVGMGHYDVIGVQEV
jgi:hypothetical protein